MAVNFVDKIDRYVKVERALVSVSDKTGLETLITGLLEANSDMHFYSTGGTYNRILEILGKDRAARHLTQVSDYTGQPETQGGLVKTLDFKIYLGLLTERYNEDHARDLERTGALPIDLVVCNLYPFQQTVAAEGVTVEMARANIDIGGPTMVRAAAKNYLRVASVVDPADYEGLVQELRANQGRLDLETRFRLAKKAFRHIAEYDEAIASYLEEVSSEALLSCYEFMDR